MNTEVFLKNSQELNQDEKKLESVGGLVSQITALPEVVSDLSFWL